MLQFNCAESLKLKYLSSCLLSENIEPGLYVALSVFQVPLRAEEITIPADVTPERVPTHIVDYSGNYTSGLIQ